jgi:DNA-binding SARP family transcriptional activator
VAVAEARPDPDSAVPRIAVLGVLRVTVDGASVPIGTRADRVVLGVLAIHAGQPVATDTLVELTYGTEEPQSGGRRGVQTAVWRLRQRFGASAIATIGDAYVLEPSTFWIDALDFDRGLLAGRTAAASSDWVAAALAFGEALDLWHGVPLGDAQGADGLSEVRRLAELRLGVIEDRAEALIRSGRPHEGIATLEELLVEQPGREHAWRLLADAWSALDRPSEAQRALDRARVVLAEVGLEPGIELRVAAAANDHPSARTAYRAMARFLERHPEAARAGLIDAEGEPTDDALWAEWLAALEAAGRADQ